MRNVDRCIHEDEGNFRVHAYSCYIGFCSENLSKVLVEIRGKCLPGKKIVNSHIHLYEELRSFWSMCHMPMLLIHIM